MSNQRVWICAQLGGREHYAIPRALHAVGALNLLMTDYWAGVGTRTLARILPAKSTRALAARQHSELPAGLVRSWKLRSFAWETQLRQLTRDGGVAGRYRGYCKVGERFGQAVVRHLRSRPRLPTNGVFFGYDTASLEAMEYLKERGFVCIVDQIDPGRVEAELVQAEQRAWPGWEDQELEIPDEFFERHIREWAIADRVVVNSEWSRQALVQQGVPARKIAVVPLSFELHDELNDDIRSHQQTLLEKRSPCFSREKPLRVLFLGQVMLRKGIQYLVEAARLLRDSPVAFDIVGPIQITDKAVASAPANVVFHGRITRDQVNRWYRMADVFVLPTLSDGFALTQIEAMANGLPVIATPNCGEVVGHGVDGFIVPPRDAESLARAIQLYLADAHCLERHRSAAIKKARHFSLARVGAALLTLVRDMRNDSILKSAS